MTARADAAAKKPVVVNVPAVEPTLKLSGNKVSVPLKQKHTGSKADAVRARIADAKRNAEHMDIVVLWAVSELGMSVALAKTYVKNNWAKA
jgi:hypothetical protein